MTTWFNNNIIIIQSLDELKLVIFLVTDYFFTLNCTCAL